MKKALMVGLIAPVMSIALVATPALASHWSDDVSVSNTNAAYVKNSVNVSADTGGNTANGGYAGGAGNGGSVNSSDDNNSGGAGGNGGNGGLGGVIVTGNATAGADVTNKVNTNKTKIRVSCDCEDFSGDIDVTNSNRAKVKNYVTVSADTGNNTANGGGAGGGAGNGGDVSNSDDDNTGGAGGSAGDGGEGGAIITGHAVAGASVYNRVNSNLTRILR